MALIKKLTDSNGVEYEYHTSIILQDGKKKTSVCVSSWIDADGYIEGLAPYKSRWGAVELDKKFPTPTEVYAKLTESRMSEVEEGSEEEAVELNVLADAVSDEE